jgi:hypothetical protein
MHSIYKLSGAILALAFLTMPLSASAQFSGVQYGARGFSEAPPGTQAFALTYDRVSIGIGVNPDTRSSIDTTTESLYMSYTRFFNLGGKTASILVSIPYVSIESSLVTECCGTFPGLPADGITDPYMQFNYMLIGGEAKSPQEFFKSEPRFQMSIHTGVRVPLGKYDSSSPLNVGANRFELRLGLPMSYTWGTPTEQTSVELVPVVYFFEDNDDPFGAGKVAQDEAFQLEFHLTRDFSPAIWGAINVIHVWGAETTTDGVLGNNDLEYTGGSFTLGTRLSRSSSISATFGKPLKLKSGNNDGNQFKLGYTYAF